MVDTFTPTPVKDIEPAYQTVKSTFLTGKTRSLAWRKQQLYQLGFLIQENEEAIIDALKTDLGRPRFETITAELNQTKAEVLEAIHKLDKWAKTESPSTVFPWTMAKVRIHKEPKGVALIIGTWNFPVSLLFGPAVGAIAAGCTALFKPAEQNPTLSALWAKLVPLYLDPTAFIIINGAVNETTALLKLRFDHIFYTGSGGIGRIVAKAAAEHLTPITLELGGKSPAVVFDDCDVKVAAKRILWGKYTNSGQVCIAPDFVLCTPEMEPKLLVAVQEAYKSLAPESVLDSSTEYCKIVSRRHYDRLSDLLAKTKGTVVTGGGKDEALNKIEVTVVRDVGLDDELMKEEIFGPILPIVTLPTKEDFVNYIKEHDNPLALYVFTSSTANRDYIFNNTRSGTFVQNDVMVQFAIPGLPFGGAGPSGYGNYHGKKSFDTFTHERASASVPGWMEMLLAARYPPYTAKNLKMLNMAAGVTIKRPNGFWRLANLLKLFVAISALTIGYKRLS